MSSFYLTLPSNSSIKYYPNNTLTNYVTKLPQMFDLNGEWEVGLSEIQFPITWYNLTENERELRIFMHDSTQQYLQATVSPPAGHYESPNMLVKQINDAISDIETIRNSIRFSYNEISKKITITFDKESIGSTSIAMSKGLTELLGFEHVALKENIILNEHKVELARNISEALPEGSDGLIELIPNKAYSYIGTNVCDLQKGFYSLYVYCDVVEHVLVGDTKAPLLRTVNVSGKKESMVNRIFQTVQYVPVGKKQFDTIEIDIRDDAGRKIPFQRGRVIVTLHFRLKKPAYF